MHPLWSTAALPIETAPIKPVVDALPGLIGQGEKLRLKRNPSANLREAIRELWQADPNKNRAEARIAIAKAAGIISEDVVLAEDMLKKARASKSRTRGKSTTGRKRASAPSVAKKTAPPSRKAAGSATSKPAQEDQRKTSQHNLTP